VARISQSVSDAELEVLKVLWEMGPATIRAVSARLQRRKRRWAYTTVQTLLNRLESKGYTACDKTSVPHVFSAAVSRDGLVRQRLRDLAENLCDGTEAPLLMALVRTRAFSEEEIRQFREILDSAKRKNR